MEENFQALFLFLFCAAANCCREKDFEEQMSLAGLSPETRIKNELRNLNCAETNFAKISKIVGRTRLSEALSGQKDFDNREAEMLLERLEEMRDLQAEIDVPIDWSQTSKIETALVVRRIRKIVSELGDSSFDEKAKQATREVSNVSR